jgi:hypothetical protein
MSRDSYQFKHEDNYVPSDFSNFEYLPKFYKPLTGDIIQSSIERKRTNYRTPITTG